MFRRNIDLKIEGEEVRLSIRLHEFIVEEHHLKKSDFPQFVGKLPNKWVGGKVSVKKIGVSSFLRIVCGEIKKIYLLPEHEIISLCLSMRS